MLLAGLLLMFGGTEGVQAQSTLDAFDPNANGSVFAVAVQPDGKILIGGDFTTLSPNGGPTVIRNRIARLNSDGTLDTGFNPDVNDFVLSIAIQTDGKILIGGLFSTVGAQTRNRIARLDAVTGAADSFDPNANGDVETIALQSDNKILIGGAFTTLTPNGGPTVTRNRIARLNSDGTADSFDTNANGTVFSIVNSGAGTLVGGAFTTLSPNGGPSVTRNRIARLNTDGTADSFFDPNANNSVFSIAVQPDGRVLIGGAFTTLAPNGGATITRNFIARLETSGLADTGFNPNADDFVLSIAVQQVGRIMVGGFFFNMGGQSRNFIARLNPDGTLDPFNPNADGAVNSIAVQADGRILVGGDFINIGGQPRNSIARFSAPPTSAGVTVSGRVFTPEGRGLRNARVILTDANGNSRSAITSAFGYYRFASITAGQTVVVSVRSKRYRFEPQVVSVAEDIQGLNFVPER